MKHRIKRLEKLEKKIPVPGELTIDAGRLSTAALRELMDKRDVSKVSPATIRELDGAKL